MRPSLAGLPRRVLFLVRAEGGVLRWLRYGPAGQMEAAENMISAPLFAGSTCS
jgi:hypothetical protein